MISIAIIVASCSAVIVASLAFSNAMCKRLYEEEDEPNGKLLPWHSNDASCPICGQGHSWLQRKLKGNRFDWSCPVCGGKHSTRTKMR